MKSLTLREKNKRDKLRRIRAAAKELFKTQGFDVTVTRDVARKANVGLATLFLYASDKRDLLFLACNDDLEKLTEDAFKDNDPSKPLLEQLTVVFRHFFEFYNINRLLSRDLLRELTFYTTGTQSERFQNIRNNTIEAIAKLVRTARESGQIAPPASDSVTARVIFYVFATEVRRWLGEEYVPPEQGVRKLRELLEVVVVGLGPSGKPTENRT